MNVFFSILVALVVFGVLILVHELGHFLVAKWAKVRVEEFSIGMGPALFKKQGKETLYSLRLLPIGGYVMLEGEDEDVDSPDSFSNKPIAKRAAVFVAGAAMNLLLGLLISAFLVITAPALGSNTVAQFTDDATSNSTGLMVGDTIRKVNGSPVFVNSDISLLLMRAKDAPVTLEVERDGQIVTLEGVKFPVYEEQGLVYAGVDFYLYRAEKNFSTVVSQSFFKAVSITRAVWSSVIDLFTGQVPLSQLSGPVGTTTVIGEAASYGLDSLLYMVLVITINLGIMNLLPIPALDGGKLLFLLIELIRGKPLDRKYEGIFNMIGFAALMLLMLVVTFGDIRKLFM